MQRAFCLRIGLPIILLLTMAAAPARAFDGCRAADVVVDSVINGLDLARISNAFGEESLRLDLDGGGFVGEEDVRIAQDFFGQVCPTCPGDLNDDGEVDADDRVLLEAAFGRDCRSDLTRDGQIGDYDLGLVSIYWGSDASDLLSAEARGDVNDDGVINTFDLIKVINDEGVDCRVDLNKDDRVNPTDVWFLLASWGPCP